MFAMVIDEEILKRVRDYGSLGLSSRQVAALLRIRHSEIESFVDEMIRSDTRLHEFYESGKAIMSYNMNVELAQQAEKGDADSIKLFDQRKQEQRYDDLCSELFGL